VDAIIGIAAVACGVSDIITGDSMQLQARHGTFTISKTQKRITSNLSRLIHVIIPQGPSATYN